MEPSSRSRKADGGAADGPRELSSKGGAKPVKPSRTPPEKNSSPNGGVSTARPWSTSRRPRADPPAVFYRYYDDKEDLLAALAGSFLHDVVLPSGLRLHLPESPPDDTRFFFLTVVSAYWDMFKQSIGIMVAVDQLAATEPPRFAALQNQFRQFGIDIVAASVLRAQEHGYAAGLQPEHTALAIALLFEQFTTVCLRPDSAGLGLRLSDDDAVTTLSTIWKKNALRLFLID